MERALTLGEIFWLITDICIVVVLAVGAIGVIIWWIRGGNKDSENAKRFRRSSSDNASYADDWLNKYYAERDEHAHTVDFYTGVIERKDKKIELMEKWDENRKSRIAQLEKQLRDNGIEPEEWELIA